MSRCVLSTRTPRSAPLHRIRLLVQAGTGIAPTPPDEMPARFRYSPNASPRSCRDACLARAPHSAQHRTGDACTYRPVMAFQPRTRCPEHSTSSAQIMGNSPPMVIRSGASTTRPGRRVSAKKPRSASVIVDDAMGYMVVRSEGSLGAVGICSELDASRLF
jgi:hypothetical protein